MQDRIDLLTSMVRGPRVLNVGCTGGLQDMAVAFDDPRWLHGRLGDRFRSLWGLDISESKISEMRARGHMNLVVGDAQEFRLGAQFDSIVAGELIEHLPNPGAFLDAATRHLAPGGELIITTPNAMALTNVLYAWLKYPRTVSNPEHTMWFCPATLRRLVESRSLTVTSLALATDYPRQSSGPYGLLVRLIRVVGRILPERLRGNAIVLRAVRSAEAQ